MTTALVVDESPFVQTVLYRVLSDRGYSVVTADTANRAIELHVAEEPELVVIDADRPDADGVAVVESMVNHHPTRVLALSDSKTIRERLADPPAGVIECLERDSDDLSVDLQALSNRVAEKVGTLETAEIETVPAASSGGAAEAVTAGGNTASVGIDTGTGGPTPASESTHTQPEATGDATAYTSAAVDRVAETVEHTGAAGRRRTGRDESVSDTPLPLEQPPVAGGTIVIGASTGGPRIVERVLGALPPALEAKVLVVQHMPASFTDRFARRLEAQTAYDVSEATDDTSLGPGEAVVAKGGYHLAVERAEPDRLDVSLTETPPRHGVRPSIDVTMETAAAADSTPLVGIVLTGMGRDGVAGLGEIEAVGGTTIAQDEATSPVFGIPRRAIEAGVAETVAPAREIAPAIVDTLTRTGDHNA